MHVDQAVTYSLSGMPSIQNHGNNSLNEGQLRIPVVQKN